MNRIKKIFYKKKYSTKELFDSIILIIDRIGVKGNDILIEGHELDDKPKDNEKIDFGNNMLQYMGNMLDLTFDFLSNNVNNKELKKIVTSSEYKHYRFVDKYLKNKTLVDDKQCQ
jgi:hypothetical protein